MPKVSFGKKCSILLGKRDVIISVFRESLTNWEKVFGDLASILWDRFPKELIKYRNNTWLGIAGVVHDDEWRKKGGFVHWLIALAEHSDKYPNEEKIRSGDYRKFGFKSRQDAIIKFKLLKKAWQRKIRVEIDDRDASKLIINFYFSK